MSKEIVSAQKEITVERKREIDAYLNSFPQNIPHEKEAQFRSLCREFNLNPFLREIYMIVYSDQCNIVVGYEVYLKRAERSDKLNGWRVWIDGTGVDMVAKVEIYRKDRKHPFQWEVEYSEYAQYKWDTKLKQNVLTKFWRTKPKTMLKKVCIAQSFRMAFPEDFGGMPYTSDEIPLQGETVLPRGIAIPKEKPVASPVKQSSTPPEANQKIVDKDGKEIVWFEPKDPKPKENKIDPSLMREACLKNKTLMEKGFSLFLIKKKWIKEDQCVRDLTDNQIERLYNNIVEIIEKYHKEK